MRSLATSQAEADFWVRHARGGVAFGSMLAGAGLVYALATWHEPARPQLAALMSAALVVTVAVLALPLRRIVQHRFGMVFVYAWSAALCALVATAIWLDGGIASPVTLMLFLPLVSGAMAYPPPGVGALGAVVVGIHLGIGLTAAGADAPRLLLGTATLALVTVVCARTAAIHRGALERQTALARQLEGLAHRDSLSGCLNRRAFHERLDIEVKHGRRHGRPLALLVVDLDGFKAVNDVYGHLTGDDLLRTLGALMRRAGRASDAAARIGGDEFALLLPDTDCAAALVVAERLRGTISEAMAAYRVTASIGVAAGARLESTRELLEAADAAVYEAKRAGRDAVRAAPAPGGSLPADAYAAVGPAERDTR